MSALVEIALADAKGAGESDTDFARRLAGQLSIAALQAGWRGAQVLDISWRKGEGGSASIIEGERPVTRDDLYAAMQAKLGRAAA